MKKKLFKSIMVMALCVTTLSSHGIFSVQAAMTEEEKEQKRQDMQEWVEEHQDEYDYVQSLSYYEQINLMTEEDIEKNGWDRILEVDDVKYCIQGDMLMSVATKAEKVSEIVIPKEIKQIFNEAFYQVEFEECAKVVLHKDITDIGMLTFCYLDELAEIDVDDANEAYCTVDGVLFSKDMTKLIAYPNMKKDSTYVVANSVTEINPWAFGKNGNLKKIQLSENIIKIGSKNISEIKFNVGLFSCCEFLDIYISSNPSLAKVLSLDNSQRIICAEIGRTGEERISVGFADMDKDGTVTLSDAQKALRKALNIGTVNEANIQAEEKEDTADITLTTAREVLKMALKITE